jgi:hypothetical protein
MNQLNVATLVAKRQTDLRLPPRSNVNIRPRPSTSVARRVGVTVI